tara:strand:+ start:319 stop:1032 length:714 start_codon:yes stop_codon:yes gene_type:complete
MILAFAYIFLIITILIIYITGFTNPISDMVVPWKNKVYFSFSAALRFCKKELCIPMLIISLVLILPQFYILLPPKLFIINSFIVIISIFTMIYSMFLHNVDGCDCSNYKLPSCCPNAPLPGQCTKEKLKDEFNDKLKLNEKCCNAPECTEKLNRHMAIKHRTCAAVIFVSIIVYMIVNLKYDKHHIQKIILCIEIILFIFIFLDQPGSKYKLVFDTVELSTILLFIIYAYVVVRNIN